MKFRRTLILGSIIATMLVIFGARAYAITFPSAVERWRPEVREVLMETNQPQDYQDVILQRIEWESGGDPNAINDWDINAEMGTPSKGLMQTIQPTFDAYAGPYTGYVPYHGKANMYAAIMYTLDTYGTLDQLTVPGGY